MVKEHDIRIYIYNKLRQGGLYLIVSIATPQGNLVRQRLHSGPFWVKFHAQNNNNLVHPKYGSSHISIRITS